MSTVEWGWEGGDCRDPVAGRSTWVGTVIMLYGVLCWSMAGCTCVALYVAGSASIVLCE